MFDSPLSASAYEVLGVDPAADEEALRKAYRLRLRQTHPDTGGDAAVFIQVQRAWELVGTAEARAAYDRGHGFGEAPASEWSGWRTPPRPADTRPAGAIVRAARRVATRALPRPDPRVGGPRRHARGPVRPGARALGPASPATHARRRARRGGHGARRLRPRAWATPCGTTWPRRCAAEPATPRSTTSCSARAACTPSCPRTSAVRSACAAANSSAMRCRARPSPSCSPACA